MIDDISAVIIEFSSEPDSSVVVEPVRVPMVDRKVITKEDSLTKPKGAVRADPRRGSILNPLQGIDMAALQEAANS